MGNQPISEYPKDWADFATYLNGTTGIFLTALNIYLFYKLTNLATHFSNASSGKQLLQSMFQSYKHSIDELVMEFLRSIEKIRQDNSSKEIYLEEAKTRLAWIDVITESFMLETNLLYANDYLQINNSYNELNEAITNLMNSNFYACNSEMNVFLKKKSNFIQKVNQIIFNYE